ncbi:hypothetical protein TELCIR_10531 [Teladorsagia circumcincta]|uniref:Integrase zinc-binding domain-containing protein n=1 Tax=Teladorsagia circumcincta TaxID=45464 RepID=A0A2G9UBW2_TELCI|nr:hypothetical protein TELCIR_10531 [Teladorsagia circumcincta]
MDRERQSLEKIIRALEVKIDKLRKKQPCDPRRFLTGTSTPPSTTMQAVYRSLPKMSHVLPRRTIAYVSFEPRRSQQLAEETIEHSSQLRPPAQRPFNATRVPTLRVPHRHPACTPANSYKSTPRRTSRNESDEGRSHVFWTKIFDDLEKLVHTCATCQEAAKSPVKSTLCSWPRPKCTMEPEPYRFRRPE